MRLAPERAPLPELEARGRHAWRTTVLVDREARGRTLETVHAGGERPPPATAGSSSTAPPRPRPGSSPGTPPPRCRSPRLRRSPAQPRRARRRPRAQARWAASRSQELPADRATVRVVEHTNVPAGTLWRQVRIIPSGVSRPGATTPAHHAGSRDEVDHVDHARGLARGDADEHALVQPIERGL